MMTRKTYIEFADMISDLINDNNNDLNTIINTVEEMMRVFKIDNRNFNATKFKDYIYKNTGYEMIKDNSQNSLENSIINNLRKD